jgi:ADP-heptose:LPS heptosyltransferase
MLLITPLVQELVNNFPDCTIDIIVKGQVATSVFKEYKNVNQIIVLPRKPFKELRNYLSIFFSVKRRNYDLAINPDPGSSSGKILTHISNAHYQISGMPSFDEVVVHETEKRRHIAKRTIYCFRAYMRQLGLEFDDHIIPDLDLKLSDEELELGKTMLTNDIADPSKETILIFTHASGDKCYSKEWWSSFYDALKSTYGDTHNFLEMLPFENISQIDFREKSIYSTDIREMAAIMANAKVFIGADCGVMHLASAARIKTIGLFAGTRIFMYKPYNSGSFAIETRGLDINGIVEKIKSGLT